MHSFQNSAGNIYPLPGPNWLLTVPHEGWRVLSHSSTCFHVELADQLEPSEVVIKPSHAAVVRNQMSNILVFRGESAILQQDNKDEGTVVSSVCMGVLQGNRAFVAQGMSCRCFPPSLTQLIPFNSFKSCRTAGETQT